MPKSDPFDRLKQRLAAEFALDRYSFHGPDHWQRVEGYGLYLAEQTGAKVQVVSLFAYFHDSCRQSDGDDPEHGPRAAEKVRALRSLIPLDEDEVEQLCQACAGHTALKFSHDVTIGTCWDSDRLDLDRVGMDPHPDYMSTAPARLLCSYDAASRRRLAFGK